MNSRKPRSKCGNLAVVSAALLPIFASACTTSNTMMMVAQPAANTAAPAASGIETGFSIPQDGVPLAMETSGELPEQLSYVPAPRPDTALAALDTQPADTAQTAANVFPAAPPAPQSSTEQIASAAPPVPAPAETEAAPSAPPAPDAVPAPAAEAAPVVAQQQPEARPAAVQEKRNGFLSAFFGSSRSSNEQERRPVVLASYSGSTPSARDTVALSEEDEEEGVGRFTASPARRASTGGSNALPGVRTTALFEIRRSNGIDDDGDVDLHEEDGPPVLMASAAGLARLAPNGLLKQTDNVDVSCLKPALVRVLNRIEQHYGTKAVVTSGYRNPFRNQKARGARNSLHMFCAAADVQVPGVSKWELAQFARSMPGRGGVGTYCHTESVHIDVGPERDWNWRCRRRK